MVPNIVVVAGVRCVEVLPAKHHNLNTSLLLLLDRFAGGLNGLNSNTRANFLHTLMTLQRPVGAVT